VSAAGLIAGSGGVRGTYGGPKIREHAGRSVVLMLLVIAASLPDQGRCVKDEEGRHDRQRRFMFADVLCRTGTAIIAQVNRIAAVGTFAPKGSGGRRSSTGPSTPLHRRRMDRDCHHRPRSPLRFTGGVAFTPRDFIATSRGTRFFV